MSYVLMNDQPQMLQLAAHIHQDVEQSTPAVSKKIQPVPIGLMVSLLKNHTTLYGLLFTIYNVQRMNIHLQSTRLISLFIYHLVDHYLTPKRNLQSPCSPCRLLSAPELILSTRDQSTVPDMSIMTIAAQCVLHM